MGERPTGEAAEMNETMFHKNCGGMIILDSHDTYRCQKCGRSYKCVGYEHYLDEIVNRIDAEAANANC